MSTKSSLDWAAFTALILSFQLHSTIGHSHASVEARTRPGIYRIEELTAPEIDALDRRKTLLLLPVGMLEEHGPHLPIGSDTYQVNFIVDGTAKRLQQNFPHLHAHSFLAQIRSTRIDSLCFLEMLLPEVNWPRCWGVLCVSGYANELPQLTTGPVTTQHPNHA